MEQDAKKLLQNGQKIVTLKAKIMVSAIGTEFAIVKLEVAHVNCCRAHEATTFLTPKQEVLNEDVFTADTLPGDPS